MNTNPNPLGELRPFTTPPTTPGVYALKGKGLGFPHWSWYTGEQWNITCNSEGDARDYKKPEYWSPTIQNTDLTLRGDNHYEGWYDPSAPKAQAFAAIAPQAPSPTPMPLRVHHKNGLFLSLGNMPYFVSASGTHYMDGEVNNHASWHGLSRETESVREGIWVEFDPDNVGDWAKLLKRNKDGVLCLQTNQKCTACPDALVPTTIEWLRAFPALMDAVMAAPAAPSKSIALSDDDLDHMAKSYWQFDGGRFVFNHRAFARAAMRSVA